MATVEQFQPEERFLLHGIPWETYLELRELPENEHIHMTYQGGMLEMMAPSRSHGAVRFFNLTPDRRLDGGNGH